ncbi:MAG: hypothetical protein QXN55_05935 [Candidatus Nitrosotenuis sp.]
MKSLFAFALLAMTLVLPSAFASSAPIEVNGKSYDVTYEATGLDVDGLEADTSSDLPTLTVFVTVTDAVAGKLDLTLDRSFFDSVGENGDEDFIIIADGGEVESTQSATQTQRILSITVPSGTSSVDIIGTVFGSPQPEAPVEQTPSEQTPTEEPPAQETPAETPTQCGPGTVLQDGVCVLETPVEQTPSEQTPTEEPPAQETPSEQTPINECGPGTVLKDGQCVLDESCGPGTILKDGQCVLDTSSTSAPTTSQGQGTQFIFGVVAAFVIAFVIMMILWAIGRASRRKN